VRVRATISRLELMSRSVAARRQIAFSHSCTPERDSSIQVPLPLGSPIVSDDRLSDDRSSDDRLFDDRLSDDRLSDDR
jgi:hypothetical protein